MNKEQAIFRAVALGMACALGMSACGEVDPSRSDWRPAWPAVAVTPVCVPNERVRGRAVCETLERDTRTLRFLAVGGGEVFSKVVQTCTTTVSGWDAVSVDAEVFNVGRTRYTATTNWAPRRTSACRDGVMTAGAPRWLNYLIPKDALPRRISV